MNVTSPKKSKTLPSYAHFIESIRVRSSYQDKASGTPEQTINNYLYKRPDENPTDITEFTITSEQLRWGFIDEHDWVYPETSDAKCNMALVIVARTYQPEGVYYQQWKTKTLTGRVPTYIPVTSPNITSLFGTIGGGKFFTQVASTLNFDRPSFDLGTTSSSEEMLFDFNDEHSPSIIRINFKNFQPSAITDIYKTLNNS